LSNSAVIPVPRAAVSRALVGSWAAPASLVLVAAVSPFERPLESLAVAGFSVTTLELTVALALLVGAVSWWSEPQSSSAGLPLPSSVRAPLIAVLVILLVAAFAAPEFRGNALRVWGRLFAATGVCLLTVYAVRTQRMAATLIGTLLAAGAVVGVLAVLELFQVPQVMDLLREFRPGFHVVGGQVRATSTLFYPTIASMYLEVAFALGLGLLALANGRSQVAWSTVGLALAGAGVIATFTRAGLITMTVSLAMVGGMLFVSARGWSRAHARLAVLAGVLMLLVLASRSPQMLVTRLSTEGSQDWYGAAYTVPPALTLRADSFNDLPVTVSNRGRLTWRSDDEPPFALSYHWLAPDSEKIVSFDGLRTAFPQPVEPGADISFMARVRAPGYPGQYLLVWDVVQEHRTWLSIEGVQPGRTLVDVEGPAVTAALIPNGFMPASVMRLPRLLLWTTALSVTRDRPWLGIGPDNFRHTYGRYLGLASWDTRVHANNAYLELLTGAGVVGLAVVLWLMLAIVRAGWQRWRATLPDGLPLFAGVAAACAAIAVHGLVDSFFTFTPTYVVFAIAVGLLFSPALRSVSFASSAAPESSAYAHCV
jgi:hypothetical protein